MTGKICILGTGLIGGYLGGALAFAGAEVTLLGRPAFLDTIAETGLHLTDLQGLDARIAPAATTLTTDSVRLADADVILVCVKSGATASAARDIAAHGKPGTVVVSFQNGVSNADILRAALPEFVVVAGMVPFNVMQPAPGHWHRGTDGAMYAAPHPALDFLVPAKANIKLKFHPDMTAVLWSKLLMNLNNAVNALSGQPLRTELADRNYRRVLAACVEEALRSMAAAGITPAQINRTPPARLPKILRWPNFIYNRLAMRQLKIDAHARSSMAADLALGRTTEIDDINGAVVRLGFAHGVPTPVNSRIMELVRAAEKGDSQRYSGQELRRLTLV
jgi:2-dehydropantoate 2-reductase